MTAHCRVAQALCLQSLPDGRSRSEGLCYKLQLCGIHIESTECLIQEICLLHRSFQGCVKDESLAKQQGKPCLLAGYLPSGRYHMDGRGEPSKASIFLWLMASLAVPFCELFMRAKMLKSMLYCQTTEEVLELSQ